jgi:hypothetical protein
VIQTTYDIVKAHGGELSVGLPLEKMKGTAPKRNANEDIGTDFEIILPIN